MKKKIPMVLMIIAGILILIAAIVSAVTVSHSRYKGITYCSDSAMCYTYDGLFLYFYEDIDDSEDTHLDLLWYKCMYTDLLNTCKEKIIQWDENKMYVEENSKNGVFTEGYYNIGADLGSEEKIDMTGKAFKNKKLELYFATPNDVIVSGSKKTQQLCDYFIDAYSFDKYTSIRYECPNKDYDAEDNYNTFSYNIKKDNISGFTKTTKEELRNINFSYYDEDFNYKPIEKNIDGHYKVEKNVPYTYGEDVWVKGDDFRIKTESYDTTVKMTISEYNDQYIQYDCRGYGNRYYYDLEKNTLCSYGVCYEKVEE